MSQCDKTTSLEVGVEVRSHLLNVGVTPCKVSDATSHELVATNYGVSTFRVRCTNSILGDGISYPEADENPSWTTDLLLPPAQPQAVNARATKALVLKPERQDTDVAAIETAVSLSSFVTPTGQYEAAPVVIFLKL